MLNEYYAARGWDPQGVPSRRKLEELGVRWAGAHPAPAASARK